jgi:hypothetical protein
VAKRIKGERLEKLWDRARHELNPNQRYLWLLYCFGIMTACATVNMRVSHSDIDLIERDLNNFLEDK